MQKIQKFALAIVLMSLFSSCQTTPGTDQLLSNTETKNGIIKAIANDREMSKEMMQKMKGEKKDMKKMGGM